MDELTHHYVIVMVYEKGGTIIKMCATEACMIREVARTGAHYLAVIKDGKPLFRQGIDVEEEIPF